jgi:hypothetical protein
MAKSREVRKLDQNRATWSTDSGTMIRFGVLTRRRLSAGRGLPRPIGARRQVVYLKTGSSLSGSVREQDAQGAVYNGKAVIDGGAGDLRLFGGLESHIVQQG